MRRSVDVNRETAFITRTAEPILDTLQLAGGLHLRVSHWHSAVWLVVGQPSGAGDKWKRNQLTNENDAVTGHPCLRPFDIKTEVHFLEITMEKRRHVEHVGVEKKETDQADEVTTRGRVELGPLRRERLKNRAVYLEVEHGDVAPFGCEKDLFHSFVWVFLRDMSASASRFT